MLKKLTWFYSQLYKWRRRKFRDGTGILFPFYNESFMKDLIKHNIHPQHVFIQSFLEGYFKLNFVNLEFDQYII